MYDGDHGQTYVLVLIWFLQHCSYCLSVAVGVKLRQLLDKPYLWLCARFLKDCDLCK